MEVNGQPLRFPEHEIPKAVNYNLQGLYGNIYIDIHTKTPPTTSLRSSAEMWVS